MVLHHLTVTNQPHNSVFKLMTDVTNLGEKFPSVQIGHEKGFGYKIILLRMHLDFLPENDHVLFTDAHDVRITGTHEDILARYWDLGADIVFAAERNCWPVKALEQRYTTTNFPDIRYKYLNSGAFIGTVKALKEFIDDNFHNVSGGGDDQTFYSNIYLKLQGDRKRVQLDTRATIFQCLHLAMEDINQVNLKNEVTGTKPLVWHSNGYLHQWFMEKLCGLPYVHQVKLEIEQQLIDTPKDVVALVTLSETFPILEQNSKYFFKVYEGLESLGVGSVKDAQKLLHEKYPDKWIALFPSDFNLPPKFDYLLYGRVIDTRKVYMFLTQNMTFAPFQLYYDKTRYDYDEFLRAGQVDILTQI